MMDKRQRQQTAAFLRSIAEGLDPVNGKPKTSITKAVKTGQNIAEGYLKDAEGLGLTILDYIATHIDQFTGEKN